MYIIVFKNYKGVMCELIDNVNEVPNRYAELSKIYTDVKAYEIKGEFNVFGDDNTNNSNSDRKEHLIKDEATRSVLNNILDVILKFIKFSEKNFDKVNEKQKEIERKFNNKNLHLEKQLFDVFKRVKDVERHLNEVREKIEPKCGSKPITKDECDKLINHCKNIESNKNIMVGDIVIYLGDNRKYVIVNITKHSGKILYKLTCDDKGFKDLYVTENDIRKIEYTPRKMFAKQTIGDFEKTENNKINDIMASIIEEKNEEIAWLKSIIQKSNNVVEYLNGVISNKDRLMRRYEDASDKKDREIESLNKSLEGKNFEIESLKSELSDLGNRLIGKLENKK